MASARTSFAAPWPGFLEVAGIDGSAAQLRALEESAGAWTDEAHPELTSREDVAEAVRGMRAAFERPYA